MNGNARKEIEKGNRRMDSTQQQSPQTTGAETLQTQEARGATYYQKDARSKSSSLAAFLSIMPGLGQIYVGYYQQGFINVVVVGSLIAVLDAGIGSLEPLCGLFLAFFWFYNMIDAYRKATIYNQALAGLGPTELPEDDQLPAKQGSLLGGILLIVFGVLALAHTKFGYSLDWLEDWWPGALILIGAYLLYKSWSDRNSAPESANL